MAIYLSCDSLCNPDGVRKCDLIATHKIYKSNAIYYSIQVTPAYNSEHISVGNPISVLVVRPAVDSWDLKYVLDHNHVVYVYVPENFNSEIEYLKLDQLTPAGNGSLHHSYFLAKKAFGWPESYYDSRTEKET